MNEDNAQISLKTQDSSHGWRNKNWTTQEKGYEINKHKDTHTFSAARLKGVACRYDFTNL